MKKIIILGSGNSGAGAIRDYLASRKDFIAPFKDQEFRIINDPNGIHDLYLNLYKNFSINQSANSVNEFLKFIKNTYYSKLNKKKKIYKKKIIKFSQKYIKSITQTEYNGLPRFYLDKIDLQKKILFYFSRFFLNKNAKDIKMLKMITPVNEKKFFKETIKFLDLIFDVKKNKKKNIVIEQGGNFWKPISSTSYYGKDRKLILVERDPKAIFSSMKMRNSLSYPGNNVKTFVLWYKEILNKIDKNEHKKIIKIKFENFFENFDKEQKKLCKMLDIPINTTNKFNLNHTLSNLYKYKKNLSRKEINYINKELKSFI